MNAARYGPKVEMRTEVDVEAGRVARKVELLGQPVAIAPEKSCALGAMPRW